MKARLFTIDELHKAWSGDETRPLGRMERKGRKQKINKPVRPMKTVNSPTRRMGESW